MIFFSLLALLISIISKLAFSATSCKCPLLSISYNSWAPIQAIQTPSKFDSLPICKYVQNMDSCCDVSILETYKNEWDLFKEYFDEINRQQLKKMSSKVENAYANRDQFLSIYKDSNSTLRSFYSSLDSLNLESTSSNNFSSQGDNLTNQIDSIVDSDSGFLNNFTIGGNSYSIKNITNDLNLSDLIGDSGSSSISDYLDTNKKLTDLILGNSGLSEDQQDYIRYLDELDEEGINREINNTKTRFDELVKARGICFSAVFRHFASLMCLSCESDYVGNGIYLENKKIHLNLSFETCSKVQNDCFDYLNKSVEMNKNSLFFANLEGNDSLNLTNSTADSFASVSQVISFITEKTNVLKNLLNQQILFTMPDNCSMGNCTWVCLNFLTSTGLNFEKIINGTVLSSETLNNVLNFRLWSRILQNVEVNTSTLKFSDSFSTNTYSKADSTNLNFTIDGSAGLKLFETTNINEITETNFYERVTCELISLWILFALSGVFE